MNKPENYNIFPKLLNLPKLQIIEEKDKTGSVVITTQFPVQKWHKRLPDPTIADAICDRLVHNSTQFDLKGDSLRKKRPDYHEK